MPIKEQLVYLHAGLGASALITCVEKYFMRRKQIIAHVKKIVYEGLIYFGIKTVKRNHDARYFSNSEPEQHMQ